MPIAEEAFRSARNVDDKIIYQKTLKKKEKIDRDEE